MGLSLDSLQILASLNLSSEQMAGVVRVLTVELAPLEARRAKDRERKFHGIHAGNSTDAPQKFHGSSTENPQIARVENKPLLSSPSLSINPLVPPSPSKPLSDEPDGFDAFWAIYPKRDGAADRKGAVKAFRAALKRTDLETLMAGLRGYVADLKSKNKIGTEFVKQARSWLNGDFWTEFAAKAAPSSSANSGVYVKSGTDAWDAWADHWRATKGKTPPQDTRGGWYFPTEFPPHTNSEAA